MEKLEKVLYEIREEDVMELGSIMNYLRLSDEKNDRVADRIQGVLERLIGYSSNLGSTDKNDR